MRAFCDTHATIPTYLLVRGRVEAILEQVLVVPQPVNDAKRAGMGVRTNS